MERRVLGRDRQSSGNDRYDPPNCMRRVCRAALVGTDVFRADSHRHPRVLSEGAQAEPRGPAWRDCRGRHQGRRRGSAEPARQGRRHCGANRRPEIPQRGVPRFGFEIASRYEGPTGPASEGGSRPYRPRGADMRLVVVTEQDGAFAFIAPPGERTMARRGDAIVEDVQDPKDPYRVQKAAFTCT